ncbi:MAG: hypothetical protein ACW99U_12780 [Candidatus Thorarchaeota archaeon]|jgi:hypothetical protein
MPARRKKEDDDLRVFEIYKVGGGVIRATIPGSWKCTFGPLTPGSKDRAYNSQGALALRFYEAENKQRACFTNVESFCDLTSMDIVEKVKWTDEELSAHSDEDGGSKENSSNWGYNWVRRGQDIKE